MIDYFCINRSNVGSEPNNFNAYADIDRSGSVDHNDL